MMKFPTEWKVIQNSMVPNHHQPDDSRLRENDGFGRTMAPALSRDSMFPMIPLRWSSSKAIQKMAIMVILFITHETSSNL